MNPFNKSSDFESLKALVNGLSDPKLERALKVRLDLHAPVPDETTHCRFRNTLVRGGVYDDLLAEVCHRIEDHGLKLKEAEGLAKDYELKLTKAGLELKQEQD